MNIDVNYLGLINFIGLFVMCLIFEKGLSLYQNRPFRKKMAFAFFLISFSVSSFIANEILLIKILLKTYN